MVQRLPLIFRATVLALMLGIPGLAFAPDVAHAVPQATPATETLDAHFSAMAHGKEWDEIIAETTADIAKTPAPLASDVSIMRFYRAKAYDSTGLLDEAAADYQAVVNGATPGADRVQATQALDIAQRKCVARPQHRQDVLVNGKVLFIVFTEADDIGLRELVDLAPVAANAAESLTGVPPHRTVMMLFNSDESVQAFEGIPRPHGAWPKSAIAHGGIAGVYIRVAQKGEAYDRKVRGNDFRFTVAHEYMHVTVAHILEAHGHLPMWLSEGMGEVAGGHCTPAGVAVQTGDFRRMLEHNPPMTLEQISGKGFNEASFGANHVAYVDPYAQAASMCNFLLLGRPPAIFGDLLQAMRRTNDFDTAFKQTFGETVEAFYTDWLAYAVPAKPGSR